ncbi:BTAD domain-containing putative transcriptional regulator [Lentzea sp. NPDC004782]|uniref:BTAD domain-containing putative transcriptional regulator n=1 Tax=Lentzea sp. NPDC004782 TaxID=3154458 RepID=UPI0033ADEE02
MKFRLLGSIEAEASGRSIPLGPPRQRGILAVLAADAGRLVLMDTLVDRVWGDAAPAQVRDSLYTYVARLRRALAGSDGQAVLVRRTRGYVLDVAPEAVDLHQFRDLVGRARQPHLDVHQRIELLRSALAQWSGTPLAAMPGEWADAVRQVWQGQRIDAAVEWAEAELSVSGPTAVIDTLTGMLIQHPLHEPLVGALMRAMHAAGRTGEALDIYARLRAELAEQLGIDPSAPLQLVHRELLRPEAGLPAAMRVVPTQLPADVDPFLGRSSELSELRDQLAGVRAGAPGRVVSMITGAAGTGKTTLAVHFGHQTRDQFPDGQLYVDLGSPMSTGDALGSMLRAMGVTSRGIPSNLDERAGLYRTLLGRRRMLVVLDGASSVKQVRPLLPGTASCLVLVISRDDLPGLEARRVELGPRPASGQEEPGPAEVADPPTGCPPLYERDEQLAALRRLAAAAVAGRGSTALIRGTAGSGRTALLDAWAGALPAGEMRVVRATAGAAEQDFAFAVARQLLEPLVGAAETARATAAGTEPSHETMHDLYRLVVRACEDGPLALVVDDAQWADALSSQWLDHLARRIGGLPVLVVVAARSDGVAAERPAGHVIALPRLSPAAVTSWVRRERPDADAEFCGACAAAAEGNPALLAELLQVLREHDVDPVAGQVPRVAEFADRLRAVAVVRRLSTQDEATRRLARALVVLGDGADWPLAAALSGLGDAETRDHAGRLARIGVLAPGGAARLRDPSIGSALTETAMTPVELAALHARAAELLYAESAPPEQVAAHLLLADPGPGHWRVEVLREAAGVARRRGLPGTGATYLRRALREPASVKQRDDLILELGADEVLSDPDTAARRLALALPGPADPLALGRTASLLADALLAAGRHEQALDALERAVADLAPLAGSDGLVRELWWRLQAQVVHIGYERPATIPAARVWADRLRALRIAGDTPGERTVLLALAKPAMFGEGDATSVNDLLDRGLRGELASDVRAIPALAIAGVGYMLTDRLDDAALRYGQMRDLADRWGATGASALALAGLAHEAWRRGERIALTQRFDDALCADLRARLSLVTVATESLVELGDPDAAAEVLRRYATGPADDSVHWAPVLIGASRVQVERGDPGGALALLLTYGRYEHHSGLGTPATSPWRFRAARISADLGQREQARQLAAEGLEGAYRWGTARVIGAGLRCLGAVTGGAEGRALLAEAVTVLSSSPARLELAWATYEWGLATRQVGEHRVGLDILGDALRMAESSGALLLAGRVRAELTAAGVLPRHLPA